MTQENYWILSVGLSSLALLVSLATSVYSYRRSKNDRTVALLEKKTEVLVLASQLHDALSELLLIYAQKLMIFQRRPELQHSHTKEHVRLHNNLKELQEHRDSLPGILEELESSVPKQMESAESIKVIYERWLNSTRSNILKEKAGLEDLNEYERGQG